MSGSKPVLNRAPADVAADQFAADVQYSTANVRGVAINRYLVNTEGTVVRQGYTGFANNISVGANSAVSTLCSTMVFKSCSGTVSRTMIAVEPACIAQIAQPAPPI